MTAAGRTVAMGTVEAVQGLPTWDAPFGRVLVDEAARRPEIVGLSADLARYTDMLPFAERFPNRFVNVGMAEQNLACVAAGLARSGFVPVATTYAVFATRRAFDFIAIQCAASRLNVKIVAGLPGLTTGYGATHQGIDDLAHMRVLPNMVVLDPCDAVDMANATKAALDYDGPVYMRLLRGSVPVVLDPASRFELGKGDLVVGGRRGAVGADVASEALETDEPVEGDIDHCRGRDGANEGPGLLGLAPVERDRRLLLYHTNNTTRW